jgi:hypothetical protein
MEKYKSKFKNKKTEKQRITQITRILKVQPLFFMLIKTINLNLFVKFVQFVVKEVGCWAYRYDFAFLLVILLFKFSYFISS